MLYSGPDLDKVGPWGHAQFGAPRGQTQTTFGQIQFSLPSWPGADLALDPWYRGFWHMYANFDKNHQKLTSPEQFSTLDSKSHDYECDDL